MKIKLLGIIAVADTLREDSHTAIEKLKKMGLRVIMLTGDNENTARTIGKMAGIDEVISGVLPDGKVKVIKELQEKGALAMVGDGVNLNAVGKAIIDEVRYMVTNCTGTQVRAVNVFIDSISMEKRRK